MALILVSLAATQRAAAADCIAKPAQPFATPTCEHLGEVNVTC